MSVGLLSALDARANERARPTSSDGGGRGEFPQVLSSTLGEGSDASSNESSSESANTSEAGASGAGNGQSNQNGAAGKNSEDASSSATAGASGASTREDSDGKDDESTAEAASLGAAAASLVLARRDGGAGETSILEDGRLTSLDSEDADASLSSRGRDLSTGENVAGGVRAGGELSREEAASVVAAIEGRSAGEGADSQGIAGEMLAKGPAIAEGGQEIAGSQRSGNGDAALVVEESAASRDQDSSGSGSDGRGDGSDRQASEQALFDRAAEGAQSAGIDPALRQAIANGEAASRAPDTVAVEGAGVIANPVAGAMTETTTTGTPGAPTPPAASDAISVQTEWLASNGGGTARLLLSPPTLGEIAIQVSLRGGVVNVVMVAHEAAARSVAEDQADRLAQAFAARDLRMDNFEVRRGDPLDLANSEFSQFGESGSSDGEEAGDDPATGAGTRSDGQGATGQAEVTEQLGQPQILSVGPEASVDLRI